MEADLTMLRSSLEKHFVVSSETQDKVHGLLLTAEPEEHSLKLLPLQDNISTSVVSELGDMEVVEHQDQFEIPDQ